MKQLRVAVFLALVAGSAVPLSAGLITYTCDANVSAGICNTLNTTIAGVYSNAFLNANANVYIQFGPTGLASSLQYSTNVTYKEYVDALTAAENGFNDVAAVNSLGGDVNNPVVRGDGVALSSALATVLGLTTQAGSVGITVGGLSCILGSNGCYNGRVTMSDAANTFYYRSGSQSSGTYDFYTAVEHETDEILGSASCIVGSGNNPATITTSVNCTNGPPATGVGAADLFRYASSGTRSYLTTANNTTAYFSINGGVTNIAGYNNRPNGADYGDWDSTSIRVQNAFGTPCNTSTPATTAATCQLGTDITNDGGSAIRVLDAVGYTVVPEPGTVGLFGLGFAGIGLFAYRRRYTRVQPR